MALSLQKRKLESLNDDMLLSKYRSTGNLEILGVLYHRYMTMVYGLCLKYYKDRELSQDAVMGIFEKLVTELERHEVKNFKSWLYVLSRNYCLMQLRVLNKEKEKIRFVGEGESYFMENEVEVHPIDKGDNNIDKALEDCIEKLKNEQKNCIKLFYYESKCYQEIAELMRMDEKKVKSHLQNGKRNLKICLENSNVTE